MNALDWPAPDWGFRRFFCFAASGIALVLIGMAITFEADWKVTACLTTLLVVIVLSYVVGATGEVWVRIFGSLSAMKAGVTLNTTTSSTTPSGTRSMVSTTATPSEDK